MGGDAGGRRQWIDGSPVQPLARGLALPASDIGPCREGCARRARDKSGAASEGRYLAEQSLAAMEEASLGMRVSMEASVGFYRSNLEKGLAYPEALFTATLNLVRAEFADDSVYARAMLRYCDIYAAHMSLLRRGKAAELTRNAIFEDLTGNSR